MESFDVNFDVNDRVYNVVTKNILPSDAVLPLLKHDSVGQNLYKTLFGDHLCGTKSLWDPLKTCNLKTLGAYSKSIKTKFKIKLFN